MSRKFIFFILIICKSFGFWDTPHMIIAQIAKKNISKNAKKKIYDLLKVTSKHFPENGSFIEAACFADDIADSFTCFFNWHIILNPYDPENILTHKEKRILEIFKKEENIIKAIEKTKSVLKDPLKSDMEKSIMLMILIHLVGDAHMPLHCISFYNKDFPNGDKGGRRFKISYSDNIKNLHRLWDSGIGLFKKKIKRPLDEKDKCLIKNYSEEVMKLYPKGFFKNISFKSPDHWVDESYLLAIDVAYKDITLYGIPSNEYIEKSRKCVLERLAFAGYRLANILEDIFK